MAYNTIKKLRLLELMHYFKKIITTLLYLTLPLILTVGEAKAAEPKKEGAKEYSSTIELRRNEKWWGLYITDSPLQPLIEPFKLNTANSENGELLSSILISNMGRYIWSEHPMRIEFDGERFKITSKQKKVEAERSGKTLRNAYLLCCHRNFPPKNNPPTMELFTRPIYETKLEFGHAQSEEALIDYAQQIVERGLPVGTIMIAEGWQSRHNPFEFDTELYPQPKQFVEQLHKMGFNVMVTVTPYLSTSGRLYRNALDDKRLIVDESGKPKVFESGDHYYMASYDMSNDALKEQLADGVESLKELGIDGFRFDCSRSLALIEDRVQKDKFVANWLSLGEGNPMTEYQLLKNRPLSPYLTRIEREPKFDQEEVEETINSMVVAGLAGFPYSYVDHTVENLGELPDNEMIVASMLQFSMVMPVSRVELAPWRIEDPVLYNSVVETLKGTAAIGDYVGELIKEGAHIAEPILRHMEYQFPNMGFADCNSQFMLGSKYLFAPSLDGESKRMVRLPKGVWIDREGKQFRGPQVMEVNCSDGGIVWFELKGR